MNCRRQGLALLLVAAAALLAAGPARAEVFPDSGAQIGPWQLQAFTRRDGDPAFEQCAIRRTTSDGFVLSMGLAVSGTRGMSAEAPSWGLKRNETYTASFTVGSSAFTFIGTPRSSNSMTFRTAPEFYPELKSQLQLTVTANQRHFTVNLDGIEAATARLHACVKEYTGRTFKSVSSPQAAAAPQPQATKSTAASPPALVVLVPPRPDYPQQSRLAGEEGTAIIDVQVDEKGQPSIIILQKSSGFPALDSSALEAVKAMRFQPHVVNGKAQVAQVRVPIRFALAQAP